MEERTNMMAIWDRKYNVAKEYYERYGDIDVPRRFQMQGFDLGYWIVVQRKLYAQNKLSDDCIQKLNEIGMIWDSDSNEWDRCYNIAKKFYEDNGHISIPKDYVENGQHVGAWLQYVKREYNKGTLSQAQIDALGAIHAFDDAKLKIWEDNFKIAEKYYKANHNLDVQIRVVYQDFRLGYWIASQRNAYRNKKLSIEQTRKLSSIGMVWDKTQTKKVAKTA